MKLPNFDRKRFQTTELLVLEYRRQQITLSIIVQKHHCVRISLFTPV